MNRFQRRLRDLIEETWVIDTHEHLVEEADRFREAPHRLLPVNDWTVLFHHYLRDDLTSSGMPDAVAKKVFDSPGDPVQKWRWLEPFWEQTRHTGFAMAVRETIHGLYGIDRLEAKTIPRLQEQYLDLARPGFYRKILHDRCRIERCHVNSMQKIFMETAQPELLDQDLSIMAFSTELDFERVHAETGKRASTLGDWLAIIDGAFATWGPRAVAVKSQGAYERRLDYLPVSREEAAPLFEELVSQNVLPPSGRKTLQDFLFRYCVAKAGEFGLPVKLHTGYYAGTGHMALERPRQNAADVSRLLMDFPKVKFVLMHIDYPYYEEAVALAKHFSNCWVDLCWAWIVSPVASVDFLRHFLLAAPSNKVLAFGGDYVPVEPVYGHCRMARKGIYLALSSLVADGWLREEEALGLVAPLLNGNARALFHGRSP
jgi:hypothetical protein